MSFRLIAQILLAVFVVAANCFDAIETGNMAEFVTFLIFFGVCVINILPRKETEGSFPFLKGLRSGHPIETTRSSEQCGKSFLSQPIRQSARSNDEHARQVETGLSCRVRSNDLGGNCCTPSGVHFYFLFLEDVGI
jgi:hypothetical protein